ncbi:hypothetical protein HPB50_001686 [Hyalomma asiaticum]|uniref:Uncharacterized protein n=1 Tax=Hyalomma asiaticum TaxID=266040 RepID=A0ACB7T520_HYAAI|nr:hypothetical protein HPB50_001686 [Hyalomma asiaticum]
MMMMMSPLGSYIGLSRRIVCLVALCVYLYQLYSFQDLLAVNNQLLQDLQAEMRTLHTYQSLFGSPQRPQHEPNLAETSKGNKTFWGPLGSYIGLSRRIICLVALCIYLYQLYSFQDLLAVNNQLLQDLQAEMRTLHTYQSLFGSPQRPQHEPNLAETNTESEESSSSESEESDAGMWSLDDMFDGDSQDDYSDDDDDDDNNNDDDNDDDDESRSNFGDNVFRETDTKSGAGLSTKRDSDAQPNEASSAAQSGWRGLSMLGALASPSTQVAPSSPTSPSAVSAVTGSRYNLRPRRSLNSSSDPLSPSHLQSPSHRRDLASPRQTLGQAAILSSDED